MAASTARGLPEDVFHNLQRRTFRFGVTILTVNVPAHTTEVVFVAEFMFFESPMIVDPRFLRRIWTICIDTFPILIDRYKFLFLLRDHSWQQRSKIRSLQPPQLSTRGLRKGWGRW